MNIRLSKETHLSKEEELRLGAIVQKAIKAKISKDNTTPGLNVYEFEGEILTQSEIDLIIKSGARAVDTLTRHNTALVWGRARKFKAKYPAGPELEDLASEGLLGLTRAIQKYDPTRGNKLSTVAVYWIDQAIARGTNNTGRLVRLPENRIQDSIEMNRIRAEFEDSDLSTDEVDKIIMERMKLRADKFIDIKNAASMPISLNRTVSYDGSDSKELMDYVSETSTAESSEDNVANTLMREMLYEKIGELTEMEQEVISAAFLMGSTTSDKRESMSDVREKYGITPQKYKRVLNTALTKVRANLETLGADFSDFIG